MRVVESITGWTWMAQWVVIHNNLKVTGRSPGLDGWTYYPSPKTRSGELRSLRYLRREWEITEPEIPTEWEKNTEQSTYSDPGD